MKLRTLFAIPLLALATLAGTVQADGVVIVNPNNSNALDAAEIARIFLGKTKTFPDGSEAVPVDQAEGSAVRDEFTNDVLKKNSSQIKSYWAQLVFTGKGTPPKEVSNGTNVKELVASNPNLIGYIAADQVDDSVKAVHNF